LSGVLIGSGGGRNSSIVHWRGEPRPTPFTVPSRTI
jgi:hypothetical protein